MRGLFNDHHPNSYTDHYYLILNPLRALRKVVGPDELETRPGDFP
jgi:hypothetical protein